MMNISKNLPQFEGEKVLLVVTGRQEADFFRARDGIIEKTAGFKVEKQNYPDQGGHFKARGAVHEVQKEKVLRDFRREFQKTLKMVLKGGMPDHIYVCAPSYLKNDVFTLFSRRDALLIKKVIIGNLYDKHPFEILEKIRAVRVK